MKIRKRTFKKFGMVWIWYSDSMKKTSEGQLLRGHWGNANGRTVKIFPPDESVASSWLVYVYTPDYPDGKMHDFRGKDAGERAFAVAEAFTRQQH